MINIYEQIYLEEINKLKDTNNNIVEEEKRLIKLKELKEKLNENDYKKITGRSRIIKIRKSDLRFIIYLY